MMPLYYPIAGLVAVAVAVILARTDPLGCSEETDLIGLAMRGSLYLASAALVGMLWPGVVLCSVLALAGALLIKACRP